MLQYFSEANFAFDIYDFDGTGTVDALYLGDLLRACDLNPTNALIEKMGGTKKKGRSIIMTFLGKTLQLNSPILLQQVKKPSPLKNSYPSTAKRKKIKIMVSMKTSSNV